MITLPFTLFYIQRTGSLTSFSSIDNVLKDRAVCGAPWVRGPPNIQNIEISCGFFQMDFLPGSSIRRSLIILHYVKFFCHLYLQIFFFQVLCFFCSVFVKQSIICHCVNACRQLLMAVQRMGWPKSEHMSCQQIQDIIANPHHNCSTTVQWTSIPVEVVRNTPHHRPQTLPLVFQISFWQVNVYVLFKKKS